MPRGIDLCAYQASYSRGGGAAGVDVLCAVIILCLRMFLKTGQAIEHALICNCDVYYMCNVAPSNHVALATVR